VDVNLVFTNWSCSKHPSMRADRTYSLLDQRSFWQFFCDIHRFFREDRSFSATQVFIHLWSNCVTQI